MGLLALAKLEVVGRVLDCLKHLVARVLDDPPRVDAVDARIDEHVQTSIKQLVAQLLVLGDDGLLVHLDAVLFLYFWTVCGITLRSQSDSSILGPVLARSQTS